MSSQQLKKRAPNLLGYGPRRRFREKRKCPRPHKQKGQQRNLKKKKRQKFERNCRRKHCN